MNGSSVEDDRVDLLPPEPTSAGRARRLVSDALVAWGHDELIDVATLLVSEVVTNALLHAGTALEVRVSRMPDGARIEVEDGSDVTPTPRNFDDAASTGRGLGILDAMAADWGVDRTSDGKVVWFCLGTRSPARDEVDVTEPATAPDVFTVRFRAVPVRLAQATIEHGDALLRELVLMSFDDGDSSPLPPLTMPEADLGPVLVALDEVPTRDGSVIDLDVELPVGFADGAIDRLALVDEADRLAREGALLVAPSLPEIAQCRRWMLGEIAMQGRGDEPTAFTFDDDAAVAGVVTGLTAEERAQLGIDIGSSVVADADNSIVFVGAEVAALLGWTAEELAGRRLTTIVPPELREAHLVGYTRFQLSGESRLLGQRVHIAALCRDGSTVPVALVVNPMGDRYHAVVRPA